MMGFHGWTYGSIHKIFLDVKYSRHYYAVKFIQ